MSWLSTLKLEVLNNRKNKFIRTFKQYERCFRLLITREVQSDIFLVAFPAPLSRYFIQQGYTFRCYSNRKDEFNRMQVVFGSLEYLVLLKLKLQLNMQVVYGFVVCTGVRLPSPPPIKNNRGCKTSFFVSNNLLRDTA